MLVRDGEDKGRPWTASVEELPGCTSHGKTSDEALDGIEAAMSKWIALALEEDRDPRAEVGDEPQRPPVAADAPHAARRPTRVRARGDQPEPVHHGRLAAAVAWRGRSDEPGTPRTADAAQPGAGRRQPDCRRSGGRRARMRRSTSFVTAALAANFVIVGIAGVVAIIVLLAALR